MGYLNCIKSYFVNKQYIINICIYTKPLKGDDTPVHNWEFVFRLELDSDISNIRLLVSENCSQALKGN